MTGCETVANRGIKDSEKLAELIRNHAGIVREVAATYARDPDIRADLTHDMLAYLWVAWPRYDDARPFPTWMYRVALNVALSHARSVYRERRVMTPLKVLGRRVGGSTGTNLIACLALAQEMRQSDDVGSVVTLLCDSGDRYDCTYCDDTWLADPGIDWQPAKKQVLDLLRA